MKVLVVEDNHANALVVRIYLEEFGFECEVVESGEAALEKLETATYSVILMDVGLRQLDGYQTTRAIRKREKEAGLTPVRIIGVTGYAFTTDRDKCYAAGMDDYLSKPYKTEDLLRKLVPESADQPGDFQEVKSCVR